MAVRSSTTSSERSKATARDGARVISVRSAIRVAPVQQHPHWGIVQKQTGADRLSLGGALACNAHGRGLNLKPIVDQVESFDLLDATGARPDVLEPRERGSLSPGDRRLRPLWRRHPGAAPTAPAGKVERVVTLGETADIMDRFEQRIRDGYLYGDFQFATDETRDSFLRRGVFSCYRPVPPDHAAHREHPTRFHPDDWARLTRYSHTNKRLAFDFYTSRYLQTSGQIYWSDSQLSAAYLDDYHAEIDRATGAHVKGSEMITEIYVERARLAAFMEDARETLRAHRANVIYGTVRLIEKDDETFLAWARERYACIIFNLHVDHTSGCSIDRAADAFRALIDLGITAWRAATTSPTIGGRGGIRSSDAIRSCRSSCSSSASSIQARCFRATGIATTGTCSRGTGPSSTYERSRTR